MQRIYQLLVGFIPGYFRGIFDNIKVHFLFRDAITHANSIICINQPRVFWNLAWGNKPLGNDVIEIVRPIS